MKKNFFVVDGIYISGDRESEINNLHVLVRGIYSIVRDINDSYFWLAKIRFSPDGYITGTYVEDEEEFESVMEVLSGEST